MQLHFRRGQPRCTLLPVSLALLLACLHGGCGPSDPIAEIRELHAAGSYAESIEPLRKLAEARPDDAA